LFNICNNLYKKKEEISLLLLYHHHTFLTTERVFIPKDTRNVEDLHIIRDFELGVKGY